MIERNQPRVQDSDVVNLLGKDFPDHEVTANMRRQKNGAVECELFVDGKGPCITWSSLPSAMLSFEHNMLAENALYAVLHESIQNWLIDYYGVRTI